jgi:hypothetical protein
MNFDDLDIARLRARRGEKWATYPADVLPLWVADMDFAPAEPIQEVLRHALENGDIGYPINPTPASLPTVFAERMQERFGWSLDPQRVEVLTDVVQGLYIALQVYSEPGDGAIVQTPNRLRCPAPRHQPPDSPNPALQSAQSDRTRLYPSRARAAGADRARASPRRGLGRDPR